MDNAKLNTKEQTHEFILICECCGKKFLTTSFFVEICPKCMKEYADLVVSLNKTSN